METWATETPILVKTAIQFLQARRFQLLRLNVVDLSHEVLSAVLQLRNGPTITCNIFFYSIYFPEVFSFFSKLITMVNWGGKYPEPPPWRFLLAFIDLAIFRLYTTPQVN